MATNRFNFFIEYLYPQPAPKMQLNMLLYAPRAVNIPTFNHPNLHCVTLPEWHLPLCLTGVIPTSSAHCSVERLAQRYMLMSCKCHIADLEVRHINERQSIIISQRLALSLTSQPPHLQMLLKVSGQHITGDTAEALGNICCDTWLHGHTHGVAHEHAHIHAFALTDTQPWLWDEGGWLMKACVHYYNIVSVEASSADHILYQIKYVLDF